MYRGPITRTFGVLLAFTCIFALIGAAAFAQAPTENANENAENANQNAQNANDSANDTVTPSTHNENAQDAGNANPNANQGENPGNDNAQVPPEDPPADAPGQQRGEPDEGQQRDDSQGLANRGSVKISDVGDDTAPPANVPHVNCDFRIDFYGFDGGDREYELRMHPPTGQGELALAGQVTLTEARGNELSGSEPISFASLDLHGIERHPQQGWHLKLTVAGADGTLEAPNKTKVFWVDCDLGVGGDDDLRAINVTKIIGNNGQWPADTEFTFVLNQNDTELERGVATAADRRVEFDQLAAGTYEVCEEPVTAPWQLTGATVSGGVATPDDGCVTVPVGANDGTVEVTFTNARTVPTTRVINVTKDIGNATWPADRSFTFVLSEVDGSSITAIDDGRATESQRTVQLDGDNGLEPGTYRLCEENLPAGWVLDEATVGGNEATLVNDCVEIVLGENDQTVAVTFTNAVSQQFPPGETPDIDVEKQVRVGNGEWLDADTAPGPVAEDGDEVSFRFIVTNTGETTLTGITLTDSDFDTDACTIPDSLVSGATFTCVLGPFDAEAGQHVNLATASTDDVSDSDRGHYIGVVDETVTAAPPTEDVAGEEVVAAPGEQIEDDEVTAAPGEQIEDDEVTAAPPIEDVAGEEVVAAPGERQRDVQGVQQVPVGGVAAGAGGTAPSSVPVAPVAALLLTFGAAAMLRREPVTSQR